MHENVRSLIIPFVFGHILILPRERNKYDYSFEYAFFDAILYFFLGDMLVLKNAIIRVDVVWCSWLVSK